jgi:4-aminobutyrate aminotransferase-like enzyme
MSVPQLFSFVQPYYQNPLLIDRAVDCHVYDESGQAYLDAYAAVASVSVGHANPRVLEAVSAQMTKVHQTTTLYKTRAVETYLEALQKNLPGNLNRHFLVNSGSEALDFACQASRAHRQRPTLIALSEGFHGGTFLAKSVTGIPAWQPVFGRDPNVTFQRLGTCRTCADQPPRTPGSKRLQPLSSACQGACLCSLESYLEEHAHETAGIILEPALGVGGIVVPCRGFFSRLQNFCERFGIDLILDEVQSGFGRCGSRLFLFQLLGLHPTMVCMGKGIANGFPMGMVSAVEQVSVAMAEKRHFSTFGGNPVSCAAALATLRFIQDEHLLRRVEKVGEYLLRGLDEALAAHPACIEIRGIGLLIGIELSDDQIAGKVLEECFRRHLLVGLGGASRNVIRIEPPLTFTTEMADQTVAILKEALAAASPA